MVKSRMNLSKSGNSLERMNDLGVNYISASRKSGLAHVVGATFLTATLYVAIKFSNYDNPLVFFSLVFAVAAGALTVYIFIKTRKLIERPSNHDLKIILLKCLCAEVISPVMLFIALGYTTASHASLINGAEEAFTFVFASVVFREVVSRAKLAGMIIVIAGVSVITIGSGRPNIGDLLLLVSAISFAFDNAYTIKLSNMISSERVVQLKLLVGSAVLALIAVLVHSHITYYGNIMVIIYVALFPVTTAIVMTTNAFRSLGVNTTGSIFAMSTPIGVILALWILHEQPEDLLMLIISTIIITTGAYIVTRSA